MSVVLPVRAPARGGRLSRRLRRTADNPWGRPRFLGAVTWLYMAWSIVPVVIAIQFSFNAGRSLTAWQGFSLSRWYWGDPINSVFKDPALQHALLQSLKLAGLDVLIAVPLGVSLALGLARWRGPGAKAANFLMLFPLVTPEIVMGVALFLVFLHLFTFIHPGTTAQLLGHVTFSISYVVIVMRGRLFSIGRDYEEAAIDLGATHWQTLRLVLLPLLVPAVLASAIIVFAISIDDFVISSWLSCGSSCDTVPINVYSAARQAPLPSINALAAMLVYITIGVVLIGYGLYRLAMRGNRGSLADLGV
ncbi:MAG TPA: ABC transporter permease [Solirubrobacteraceae bacterium]|jgi:spermidine/putrescine transport system permease protein|nr:ABC transporter permease [Solirubrobacteraceae bacterium]